MNDAGSAKIKQVLATVRGGLTASYAGADRRNAARLLALVYALSSVIACAYLPFARPTDAIGEIGWVPAAVVVLGGLAVARRLLRSSLPTFDELLALAYLGLAGVVILEWLAGPPDSPYRELFLLWLGAAVGTHPIPRALAFLAATVAATFLPLLYGTDTPGVAAELAANIPLWIALSLLVMALMAYVRRQRVSMRAAEREAQELARADELTLLGNRRAFDEALDAEMGRTRRAGSMLSVALIDVDRFKQVNDRFGHLEGDRCLKEVAAAVTSALRAGDRAFRWGGDEFALILPDTGYPGAVEALARVASRVERSCFDPGGETVSVAFGVAELAPAMGREELLAQADLALMAEKGTRTAALA